MSNQYTHIYQHQQPQLHASSTDDYQPQSRSQPPRSSQAYPQPAYQFQHTQPLPPPVSPTPLHYLAQARQVDHVSQSASNFHPISAPSPQYPQQLPGVPHVGYNSPSTSPVSNGLSRRPLPTPGAPPSQITSPPFRPPLPTPGPTPAPTSPLSHSRTLRSGSFPSSNISVTSPQLATSPPSASPTSPTSGRRPLPLPRSSAGSSSDTATRSSSPAKDGVMTSSPSPAATPLHDTSSSCSSPRTKFVPYWKRTLPEPSADRAVSAPGLQEAVNPAPPPDASQQLRDRSKSFTSGRPLPPSPLDGSVGKPPLVPPTINVFGESSRVLPHPSSSPVRASTRPPSPIKLAKSSSSLPPTAGPLFSARPASPSKVTVPSRPISPASSADDDGKPSQNGKAPPEKDHGPPSPQYGIRDLPLRSHTTKHVRVPASFDVDVDEPPRGRSNRSSTLPQPPQKTLPTHSNHRSTKSASLRSAPVAGPSRLPVSTPASPTGWPNTLPPLPRAPKPGAGEQPRVNRTSRNPRREYVNLDDAPPPSLRRSPSPSGVSHRTVPRIKTRSMASTPLKGLTHDALPQVSSAPTHQGHRSRSVTPASARQPLIERPRVQQPPASRPPPSAFSQRFVSGKPAPAEPHVTTTRVTIPHISTPGAVASMPTMTGEMPLSLYPSPNSLRSPFLIPPRHRWTRITATRPQPMRFVVTTAP
ncbi:hypothetical protein BC826DRAFT_233746 [Russula brevipes]|nr:hypothetical protein BC826DRAFT_233746 [Russula brevipes]